MCAKSRWRTHITMRKHCDTTPPSTFKHFPPFYYVFPLNVWANLNEYGLELLFTLKGNKTVQKCGLQRSFDQDQQRFAYILLWFVVILHTHTWVIRRARRQKCLFTEKCNIISKHRYLLGEARLWAPFEDQALTWDGKLINTICWCAVFRVRP